MPDDRQKASAAGRTPYTQELYRPFVISTVLMFGIFTIGVAGYMFFAPEASLLDAIYMTVITLTTVGYGEIVDLSTHPGGRVFTIVLLFFGVGTFVYFFSSLTGFIVEGNLEHLFWRRKMQKAIDQMKDHFIVCGGGYTGRHIVRELAQTGRDFVLIEGDENHVVDAEEFAGAKLHVIIGDATDDHTLIGAGIERASGIFSCVSNDKDNLIVTVSARLLNPGVRIISRCMDEAVEQKIKKAGADVVISPNMIGGLRMASAMVRPTVVSFLDLMLRARERLRVEESTVASGSRLDGKTVEELRHLHPADALLIATRTPDGDWQYNPLDEVKIVPGMTLIYMGSPGARGEMEKLCDGSR
jgi:voltage-gated potassium channel